MKVCTGIVVSAIGLSMAIANPSASFRGLPDRRGLATVINFPSGLSEIKNSDSYHMKTVHVVQARVQSDKPVWNSEYGIFVSKYYTEFSEAFRGVMDTVNLASVEGALMYVQAEGINYNTRGTADVDRCKRKNNMKYVVFYDIVMTQTNETLAQYEGEYGPFIAMDGGQCTPRNASTGEFPVECHYFNGTNGQPNIGPFVGGEERETDPRAPYPDTWWYSYPNTCPLKPWLGTDKKTDACRASTRGGLCAYDKKPDGVTCTYNYRILGWVPIDDLVGITGMTFKANSTKYPDFYSFCADGKVEFSATTEGVWESGIDFWKNPQDSTANAARAEKLVDLYAAAVTKTEKLTQVSDDDLEKFKALPTVASLAGENPECYNNVAECATAEAGCKRELYSQICSKCDDGDTDTACKVAPIDFKFPTLVKATPAPTTKAPVPSAPETPTPTPTTKSTAGLLSTVGVASLVASVAISLTL